MLHHTKMCIPHSRKSGWFLWQWESTCCQVAPCVLLPPSHSTKDTMTARLVVQLSFKCMPDTHIQMCRSMVAGKTNSKAKTGSAALGSVRDWCHSYDLTKPTILQDLSQSRAVCPVAHSPSSLFTSLSSTCALCTACVQLSVQGSR